MLTTQLTYHKAPSTRVPNLQRTLLSATRRGGALAPPRAAGVALYAPLPSPDTREEVLVSDMCGRNAALSVADMEELVRCARLGVALHIPGILTGGQRAWPCCVGCFG